MSTDGTISVVGSDATEAATVELDRWVALAEATLAAEGVLGAGELNLTFVDTDAMTELNETHMGHTGPTDVLSFPLDDAHDAGPAPVLLGDIVICPTVAAANAASARRSVDDELALLVVHGILHILGLDHATADEAAAMQARERALLAQWST